MHIINDDPSQISAMLAVIEGLIEGDQGVRVIYTFDMGHPLDLPEPPEGRYELIGQFTRVKHATHSVRMVAQHEDEEPPQEHTLDVSKIQLIEVP